MSDVGTAGATARDEVVMVVRNKLHVSRNNKLDLSAIDTWSLGITIVIGGQYFAWNAGLTAGFGSFLIATFFIATGYFSLIMCIAELSSALPFAGGSYGIARVTIGIFPGYLVGCFDSIESVMYVAVAAVTIGDMVTSITHWSKQYEPLYWLAFYISALLIHVWGGKSFWILNRWMAVVSFLIVLMYILGGIKYAHFSENAMWRIDDINNNNSTSSTISSSGTGSNSMTEDASLWFQGGALEFMKVYPLPCWFFVGVESINLACKDMVKPKRDIPRGYVSCVSTLFCTCFGVLFVAVSMNPGVPQLASELNPLNFGFVNMFGCSEEVATAISLPATYATAFGFMFCYGRQLRSMGQSGLLNQYVGKDLPVRFTPYVALILGCIIGYSFCFIIWLVPEVSSQMFNVSMLGAFGAYFSQFISFVQFRRLYESNIKRHFISPLGVPGAVYGFCVYFVAFISICGFQDNQYAIITFIAYIAAVSLYYVLVVRHRQFFSDEEKLVLFRAHLLKNNRAKAERLRKCRETAHWKYLHQSRERGPFTGGRRAAVHQHQREPNGAHKNDNYQDIVANYQVTAGAGSRQHIKPTHDNNSDENNNNNNNNNSSTATTAVTSTSTSTAGGAAADALEREDATTTTRNSSRGQQQQKENEEEDGVFSMLKRWFNSGHKGGRRYHHTNLAAVHEDPAIASGGHPVVAAAATTAAATVDDRSSVRSGSERGSGRVSSYHSYGSRNSSRSSYSAQRRPSVIRIVAENEDGADAGGSVVPAVGIDTFDQRGAVDAHTHAHTHAQRKTPTSPHHHHRHHHRDHHHSTTGGRATINSISSTTNTATTSSSDDLNTGNSSSSSSSHRDDAGMSPSLTHVSQHEHQKENAVINLVQLPPIDPTSTRSMVTH